MNCVQRGLNKICNPINQINRTLCVILINLFSHAYINSMRLISYDVGIKNLAYCVLEYDDKNTLSILDWNVLSLLEQEAPDKQCTQTNPGKNKKAAPTPCGKIAKYQKNGQCYCDKHAI
jgi:Mitochondrial resolvase Ydc2 / RNA splicing MRS1